MSGLRADLGLTRGEFTLGVAFAIEPGARVALLGPNGAGKTTAVDALSGLASLDSGRIELDDEVLDEPNRRVFVHPEDRKIGVVFQDYILFPHLSAVDNVAFGLRSAGVGRSQARKEAYGWLERCGIANMADRKPSALSGGEAQRVALARALAGKPRLLLLDEPLAALDASTRVEIRHLLGDHLSEFAGPSLVITHDPAEAFLLADMIHVVENGAVTQTGTVDEIMLQPRTGYIADLAGVNLVQGSASKGTITIGGHLVQIADTAIVGPVLATIHPRAISLHRNPPEGSPRNSWQTTIARVEHYGDRVRVQTGVPLPLTAEVTPGARDALGLEGGSVIWLSIKATEIGVQKA